ncbi:MAG: TRAP transporter large permease subunit [Thiolinea sp.]
MNVLAQRLYGIATDYVLISVPVYLHGDPAGAFGIARDMYSSLNMWMSRTRGGVAMVTALMAIVMAAMSGIISGEVVLLGLIALQMLRLGYDDQSDVGTICASGSLGTMIPPSIVLIFYGLITETSIQALFQAAFVLRVSFWRPATSFTSWCARASIQPWLHYLSRPTMT